MLHIIIMYLPPHGGNNGIAADFPHGSLRHKVLGAPGEDNVHLSPLLAEAACQIHAFIGGDTAGNAQNDFFSIQHIVSSQNPVPYLMPLVRRL